MDYRRFFTNSLIDKNIITLDGDEFLHCTKVTRHKIGFKIIVCNGDGYDYLCNIEEIFDKYLTAKIESKEQNISFSDAKITLYQSIAKETDFIVQKAVELGVSDIILFKSMYSCNLAVKIDRLQKIIIESAKQCGRAILPNIMVLNTFEDMLSDIKRHKLAVLCYEKERALKLTNIIDDHCKDIAIVIGSEGGFDVTEIAQARDRKINIVSLGKNILRAETASIVALALLQSSIGAL